MIGKDMSKFAGNSAMGMTATGSLSSHCRFSNIRPRAQPFSLGYSNYDFSRDSAVWKRSDYQRYITSGCRR